MSTSTKRYRKAKSSDQYDPNSMRAQLYKSLIIDNMPTGKTVSLHNGAVANVHEGTYIDNATNRRLGRVGKTYKTLRFVRGPTRD